MTVVEYLRQRCARVAGRAVRRLTAVVSGIAFWTGIIAPLSYLLFILPGVQTEGRFTTFIALIGINYLALILGYPYRNSEV